jgi:hypothetical protein
MNTASERTFPESWFHMKNVDKKKESCEIVRPPRIVKSQRELEGKVEQQLK